MNATNRLAVAVCAAVSMATGGYGQLSPHLQIHGASSYLGVGFVDLTSERAKALSLKEERGIEIKSVDPDSPAAKAGLKEGDVVLEFGGQPVQGVAQFIRLVGETPPGRKVRLAVWRNGSMQTVTAQLESRPRTFTVIPDGNSRNLDIDPRFVVPTPPTIPTMPEIAPRVWTPDFPRGFPSWQNPVLGIESESLNSQLAEYFGVKEGVLVRSVNKKSAAERSGLRAGDVIMKVDGTAVTSPREISQMLRSAKRKSLPFQVMRRGKEMTLEVHVENNSQWNGGSEEL